MLELLSYSNECVGVSYSPGYAMGQSVPSCTIVTVRAYGHAACGSVPLDVPYEDIRELEDYLEDELKQASQAPMTLRWKANA